MPIKRSRSGKVKLYTGMGRTDVLTVRQEDPFAPARHVPGWRVFFVGRHPGYVKHHYRPA